LAIFDVSYMVSLSASVDATQGREIEITDSRDVEPEEHAFWFDRHISQGLIYDCDATGFSTPNPWLLVTRFGLPKNDLTRYVKEVSSKLFLGRITLRVHMFQSTELRGCHVRTMFLMLDPPHLQDSLSLDSRTMLHVGSVQRQRR
jgi:hypothetical protein